MEKFFHEAATALTSAQTVVTFVVALVTASAVCYMQNRLTRRLMAKDEEAARRDARRNRELNVRREYTEVESNLPFRGKIKKKIWRVNPYWLEYHGDCVKLKDWPDFEILERKQVKQEGGGSRSQTFPLDYWHHVESAKYRHEWMVFSELGEGRLIFKSTEPCSPEDAPLFHSPYS